MATTHNTKKISMAGLLVAMGVVYGDIGTSPLYVMKSIVEDNGGLTGINPDFVIGSVSLIFWTLTLLTTIKYVVIALNADNHGEGGIFSL
ncbi:KUP/HAK/KT family potassium transporter, partial [Enterococcus faecium]